MCEKILLLIVFAKCNVDDRYLRMWRLSACYRRNLEFMRVSGLF